MKITVWHYFELQCLAKEEFFLHCIHTFNAMNILKGINIDVTLDRYYYIKEITIKYVKYVKLSKIFTWKDSSYMLIQFFLLHILLFLFTFKI